MTTNNGSLFTSVVEFMDHNCMIMDEQGNVSGLLTEEEFLYGIEVLKQLHSDNEIDIEEKDQHESPSVMDYLLPEERLTGRVLDVMDTYFMYSELVNEAKSAKTMEVRGRMYSWNELRARRCWFWSEFHNDLGFQMEFRNLRGRWPKHVQNQIDTAKYWTQICRDFWVTEQGQKINELNNLKSQAWDSIVELNAVDLFKARWHLLNGPLETVNDIADKVDNFEEPVYLELYADGHVDEMNEYENTKFSLAYCDENIHWEVAKKGKVRVFLKADEDWDSLLKSIDS